MDNNTAPKEEKTEDIKLSITNPDLLLSQSLNSSSPPVIPRFAQPLPKPKLVRSAASTLMNNNDLISFMGAEHMKSEENNDEHAQKKYKK